MTASFTEDAAMAGDRRLAVPDRAAAPTRARLLREPVHFAWIVAGLVFVVLLTPQV